jgi:hypothetical protein
MIVRHTKDASPGSGRRDKRKNDSAFTSSLAGDPSWPPVLEEQEDRSISVNSASRPLSEPEELHDASFSFLATCTEGPQKPEGGLGPPKWRKTLWLEQPYPDNYTDSTFLQELVRLCAGKAAARRLCLPGAWRACGRCECAAPPAPRPARPLRTSPPPQCPRPSRPRRAVCRS